MRRMKEVIAIIRMNAIQKTKRAVADLGLPSVTAEKVFGRGETKGAASLSRCHYQSGR